MNEDGSDKKLLAKAERVESPGWSPDGAKMAFVIGKARPGGLDRINPRGGGISLGHPIGCTGARIAVTIIYDMLHRNLHRGLETMCIGGGMGMVAIWER